MHSSNPYSSSSNILPYTPKYSPRAVASVGIPSVSSFARTLLPAIPIYPTSASSTSARIASALTLQPSTVGLGTPSNSSRALLSPPPLATAFSYERSSRPAVAYGDSTSSADYGGGNDGGGNVGRRKSVGEKKSLGVTGVVAPIGSILTSPIIETSVAKGTLPAAVGHGSTTVGRAEPRSQEIKQLVQMYTGKKTENPKETPTTCGEEQVSNESWAHSYLRKRREERQKAQAETEPSNEKSQPMKVEKLRPARREMSPVPGEKPQPDSNQFVERLLTAHNIVDDLLRMTRGFKGEDESKFVKTFDWGHTATEVTPTTDEPSTSGGRTRCSPLRFIHYDTEVENDSRRSVEKSPIAGDGNESDAGSEAGSEDSGLPADMAEGAADEDAKKEMRVINIKVSYDGDEHQDEGGCPTAPPAVEEVCAEASEKKAAPPAQSCTTTWKYDAHTSTESKFKQPVPALRSSNEEVNASFRESATMLRGLRTISLVMPRTTQHRPYLKTPAATRPLAETERAVHLRARIGAIATRCQTTRRIGAKETTCLSVSTPKIPKAEVSREVHLVHRPRLGVNRARCHTTRLLSPNESVRRRLTAPALFISKVLKGPSQEGEVSEFEKKPTPPAGKCLGKRRPPLHSNNVGISVQHCSYYRKKTETGRDNGCECVRLHLRMTSSSSAQLPLPARKFGKRRVGDGSCNLRVAKTFVVRQQLRRVSRTVMLRSKSESKSRAVEDEDRGPPGVSSYLKKSAAMKGPSKLEIPPVLPGDYVASREKVVTNTSIKSIQEQLRSQNRETLLAIRKSLKRVEFQRVSRGEEPQHHEEEETERKDKCGPRRPDRKDRSNRRVVKRRVPRGSRLVDSPLPAKSCHHADDHSVTGRRPPPPQTSANDYNGFNVKKRKRESKVPNEPSSHEATRLKYQKSASFIRVESSTDTQNRVHRLATLTREEELRLIEEYRRRLNIPVPGTIALKPIFCYNCLGREHHCFHTPDVANYPVLLKLPSPKRRLRGGRAITAPVPHHIIRNQRRLLRARVRCLPHNAVRHTIHEHLPCYCHEQPMCFVEKLCREKAIFVSTFGVHLRRVNSRTPRHPAQYQHRRQLQQKVRNRKQWVPRWRRSDAW